MTSASQRLRADLMLLLTAAIWGVGFLFQKQAMASVGVLTFLAARSLLAAITLAPFAVLEHRRASATVSRRLLSISALSALIFLVAGFFQQSGLLTASVTNTGFLTGLYVVFTPFIAWLAYGRVPSRTVLLAVALSFAGVWLMGGGTFGGFSGGDHLIAASAVGWACHVVVLAEAAKLDRPIAVVFLTFALVAITAGTLAWHFEQPTVASLSSALGPILYVGILSSALTFTLFTYAVRHTSPSEVAVIVSTECLFAAAAGAIVLGERLMLLSWIGAALILASILLVQLAPRPAPH